MSKSKFISRIKEMFSNEFEDIKETTEEVVEETKELFLDVATDEGVMVRISEPVEVGSTVELIDEEGEVVGPAPDGEHMVEGIAVVVLDGVISEIIQPEVEEEVVEEPVAEEPVEEEMKFATVETVVELTEKLNNMELKFNETVSLLEELKNKFVKFSNEPAVESTKTEAKFSSTKSNGKMSKEDKIKFFAKRNK